MTDFATPVGRLVQGSVLELNVPKDKAGKPKLKKGTNELASPEAFIAVAFQKTQAAWWLEPDPFWALVYNTARQTMPTCFDAQGNCTIPRFAWKIVDGDGRDDNGRPNSEKEGHAGHWVVKFKSNFAPKLIHNGVYIDDKNYVKRGYFVRVFGSCASNAPSETPGLYMNQNGVELVAYGHEIKSGPDILALAAAAARPAALPAGASLVPLAGGPAGLPPASGAPGVPGAGLPPPVAAFTPPAALAAHVPALAPVAGIPSMAPPGLPAAPGVGLPPANHAFVQNAVAGGLPPLAAAAPLAPAAPVYAMTAAAGTTTREQAHAQGYTDEALVAAGYMVRTA